MSFELFAYNFLDKQIIAEKPFDCRKRMFFEVQQNDSHWEFFFPAPIKRFAEIGVINFKVDSSFYKFLEGQFERIIILSFEKFGN